MSNSVREKIIELLGHGISQVIVAESVGVSESYISQLLELDEVREAVALKKASKLSSAIEADTSMERIELKALKLIDRKLDGPLVPLREAINAFSVLNAARKKADPGAGNGAGVGVDTVVFVLPKAAKTMIQINSDNQIVEVDGRSTAPLPSRALPGMQKAQEIAARLDKKLQEASIPAIPAPHVQDLRERVQAADLKRAHSILKDITTTLNGVEIVI